MTVAAISRQGVLVDLTRCIGCRACQVSCKQWNDGPASRTKASPDFTNPPALNAATLTHVRFVERERDGAPAWSFVKSQCMHCNDPACASACPVGAMQKTASGAVTYDYDKCMGCRYCMMACPFGVPTFEWDRVLPRVRKCSFCAERTENGMAPACVKTCPTGALVYGDRDQLLAEAERRIAASPAKYVDYVYGKTEAGGTGWMYISGVPFEQLGFRTNVPKEPLPALTWRSLSLVPYAAGALVVGLSAVAAFRSRALDDGGEPKKGDRP